MKQKKSPISALSICVTTHCVEGAKRINELEFDNRNDFSINRELKGVAAELAFYNERRAEPGSCRGIRRRVTVSLVDMVERRVLAATEAPVVIPRDEVMTIVSVNLPAGYDDVVHDRCYKIVVKDKATGDLLADKIIRFYDETVLGTPDMWYSVTKSGVVQDGYDSLCRSISTGDMEVFKVRFMLEQHFGSKQPAVMPEVEIRFYDCDGNVHCSFVEPGRDCTDGLSATAEFFTREYYSGICYAELISMDHVVAGMVFNTAGPLIIEEWSGDDLTPLDEYSTEAAVERYNRATGDETEPESAIAANEAEDNAADDPFDEILDRFIASELEKLGNEEPGEDEEVEEEPCADIPTEEEEMKPVAEMLDDLTGLQKVKEKLSVYERTVIFNKMRDEKGLKCVKSPLHAMFLGSPGTGKTTVAKKMGLMLHRAGLLSKGHVVVRERATLLGQYYSSEGENTLKAIEEAQGGILFIDEAYQLYQRCDPRDPGKFVIETLLTALADESMDDWMLILAGYPEEMKQMFEMNPGFKSRIPDNNIYDFDDFSQEELMEIAMRFFTANEYTLTAEARDVLTRRLTADYLAKDKSFGNARHVMNLINTEILPAMAVRVTSAVAADTEALSIITAADIPAARKTPSPARPQIGYR